MSSESVFSQNYFQLLALPVSYSVDKDALHANYVKLQKQFHPDKFSNASSQEQRIAVQFTAQLNEARLILLDDVQRGRYLLSLEDVDTSEEQTISDMDFLMQQMEWREKVQSFEAADASSVNEEKALFVQKMQQEYQGLSESFSQAFASKQWADAKLQLAKLQFMQKILRELN